MMLAAPHQHHQFKTIMTLDSALLPALFPSTLLPVSSREPSCQLPSILASSLHSVSNTASLTIIQLSNGNLHSTDFPQQIQIHEIVEYGTTSRVHNLTNHHVTISFQQHLNPHVPLQTHAISRSTAALNLSQPVKPPSCPSLQQKHHHACPLARLQIQSSH